MKVLLVVVFGLAFVDVFRLLRRLWKGDALSRLDRTLLTLCVCSVLLSGLVAAVKLVAGL